MIEDYGRVQPMPGAHGQLKKDLEYKVVFDITKVAGAKDKVNPGLDHVARFINLLGLAGVEPTQAKLVAVVHGPATDVVLANEAYKAKTGVNNPNLALIRRLNEHGAEVHVCGQALAEHGFDPKIVDRHVQIDLAAMTTLAIHQLHGFALMPD